MAMDMFLVIKDIPGETKDKVYSKKGGIDVLAYSWGLSQSGTAHTGGGSGSGKVSCQDISCTKYVDQATNLLMMHCMTGKHIPEVTLVVRKAGGDSPLEYMTYKLSNVLVSSQSQGGSGGEDRLTENLSLNFQKIEFIYKVQAEKGGQEGGDKITKWDIAANAKF